jgi:DNA-binding LacI/PurR family transcriptional regulator
MIKQGHSRIGYVRYGGSESHYSVADRLAGYEQAMNLAGLAPLICQVNESIQLPVDVFCEKLIDENPLITAWVCYGDNVAVALSLVLINRGMDIHKVYQIGTPSAGISVLDHMTKYLPVVVTPEKWTKVGSIAVQMLLKKIKNPDRRLPANSV